MRRARQHTQGDLEIRAALDGGRRRPALRCPPESRAQESIDLGAPMDVLWMRVAAHARRSAQNLRPCGRRAGFWCLLDRGAYWQCAFVIPKGGYERSAPAGLRGVPPRDRAIAPFLRDRVEELRDWDDVKLLTVRWIASGNGTGRTPVHWRCRARDVADRRSGN